MSSENIIEEGYKISIGRNRTRVTTYENLVLQTTHPIDESKPKKIKPSIPSEYADHNYYLRQKRRRETVKELAYNSFEYINATMVTLTFDQPMTDLVQAHKLFNLFIKRVNDHYDYFRYLATFSRQTNGNWHYHVLTNFPATTKNSVISELWQNGITYISYFDKQSKFTTAINYLISNMESSSEDTKGRHGYLASKNLERNIVITSYKSDDTEKFDEVFPKILEAKNKILYQTQNHLGIKGTNVDKETGEIFEVRIPAEEMDAMLEAAGYESWDSTFTHLSSAARFEDQFSILMPAVEKKKKYKRKKSEDAPEQ